MKKNVPICGIDANQIFFLLSRKQAVINILIHIVSRLLVKPVGLSTEIHQIAGEE